MTIIILSLKVIIFALAVAIVIALLILIWCIFNLFKSHKEFERLKERQRQTIINIDEKFVRLSGARKEIKNE